MALPTHAHGQPWKKNICVLKVEIISVVDKEEKVNCDKNETWVYILMSILKIFFTR